MAKKIGFIGAGNMGKAIIAGLIAGEVARPENITVFDVMPEKVKEIECEYHIKTQATPQALAEQADILFIAVKPDTVAKVLAEIKDILDDNKIIVSIAAGVSIDAMTAVVGERKIIRVMPNTPALVNAGMSSVSPAPAVTQDELEYVLTLINSFGKSQVVPESLIHAVIGVSGSAPAYVFMMIEAMADAAVLAGMARSQAYYFAAQTLLGSAKMVIETGLHPGELKDRVCSPGGTTIEAVKSLENKGFRSAIIDAITDCIEKSKKMTGN